MANSTVMDRYSLFEVVACGGWSELYKGRDLKLDREIAFKVLYPHLSWDPESLRRFHQEARAAARISHQNVVSVFDYGVLPQGEPFIVMEYVAGRSLREVLEQQNSMPWKDALNIFIQAGRALDAAHSMDVIHRDVKPGNILIPLDSSQPVKLVDFGLAKVATSEAKSLTQSGATLGTPLYMSPEQCKGARIDRRSDLYSLGCVMYETLTGKPPFDGESVFELMLQHVNQQAPSFRSLNKTELDVPEDLEAVVKRCMMKAQKDRYATAADLLSNLKDISSGKKLHILASWRGQRLYAVAGLMSVIAVVTIFSIISPHSLAERNKYLRIFDPQADTLHVERPPGLASIDAEQAVVVPQNGLSNRQVRKENKPDGSVSYFYTGKIGDWNPFCQVPFLAQVSLDPQGDLSSSSVSYMGDIRFNALTEIDKAKSLEHVKEVRTVHTEDGWLATEITCFNGKKYAVLTAEDGRVHAFVSLADATEEQ